MILVRKVCSEETPSVVGKHVVEQIWCVIRGHSQLPWGRPEIDMELSRKGLWTALSSNDLGPHDIHRRPTRCLGMLSQQK